MSARILDTAGGVITIEISGKLTQPELAAVQQQAAAILREWGRAAILVVADHFEGWEQGGDWEDPTFQLEHDRFIGKLAIVGDKQWESLVYLFTSKKFREFPIEFFASDEVDRAREWCRE